MNKDLLIKLVKLANNNPNDNEANLAARKACKIIAEENFAIIGSDPSNAKRQPISSHGANSSYYDPFDFVRKYYEGRDRTARQANQERAEKTDEQYRRSKEEKYRNPFDDFDFGGIPFEGGYSYEPKAKEPKKKQPLRCRTCGVTNETAFVGPPQMYQCHKCQWDEYMKTTGGAK